MLRKAVSYARSTHFVRKLRWRRLRPELYGFTYHRIGNASECEFDRGVYCCSQNDFRKHVKFLLKCFEVVNLERLIWYHGRKTAPSRPLALITFDDGYLDNYTLAFPVLRELETTAAFYPPTAYVESKIIPWWDEIAWTLRQATVPSIRLRAPTSNIRSTRKRASSRSTGCFSS